MIEKKELHFGLSLFTIEFGALKFLNESILILR